MKLSNKKIRIIIFLMTVALSGLIVLQAILLKTALKSEEETFQRNVNLALHNVVSDLMSAEARSTVQSLIINDTVIDGNRRIVKSTNFHSDTMKKVYMFHKEVESDTHNNLTSSGFSYGFDNSSENIKVLFMDSSQANIDIKMKVQDSLTANHNNENMNYYSQSFTFDSREFNGKDSSRIMLIEAALTELEFLEILPIEDRVDTLILDSAIKASLQKLNINLKYNFAVTNVKLDSAILSVREPNIKALSKSPYKSILFPNDFLISSNFLILDFPNKQFFIISKLMGLIFPTIFFLLIIISIFIYSMRLILGQRKTSIRLTDFINNMTHEFKTPISTIQLASEAIAKEEVFSNREKMLSYNKMVLSENKRMKSHVDKILQIATLEEGDYILSREQLDMRTLIEEVIESFQMLLKQQDGTIVQDLRAERFMIDGDRVHIVNIIYNLLDNALKYSKKNPQISVSTENINDQLQISIKDKGIGVHPDDLKFLFDKYYRVVNGDVHDIKGFGLGLSYVKMMVEAHKGTVKLLSSLDKGTEVIVLLPLT